MVGASYSIRGNGKDQAWKSAEVRETLYRRISIKNKIAWSDFFQEFIICVKYLADDNWYFIFRDAVGNQNPIKAKTKYSYFDWQ